MIIDYMNMAICNGCTRLFIHINVFEKQFLFWMSSLGLRASKRQSGISRLLVYY